MQYVAYINNMINEKDIKNIIYIENMKNIVYNI